LERVKLAKLAATPSSASWWPREVVEVAATGATVALPVDAAAAAGMVLMAGARPSRRRGATPASSASASPGAPVPLALGTPAVEVALAAWESQVLTAPVATAGLARRCALQAHALCMLAVVAVVHTTRPAALVVRADPVAVVPAARQGEKTQVRPGGTAWAAAEVVGPQLLPAEVVEALVVLAS